MRKLLLSSAALAAVLGPLPSYAQVSLSVTNEGATGTTIGKLAKFTATNPVTAIIATTGDTDGVVGIVSGFSLQGSTGITGNAYISQVGITNCTFDTGGVTAKHYVIASTIAGGSCADGGATRPTGVQVIGIAQATGGSGASVAVQLDRGFANAGGSGSPANPTATAGPTAVNGAAGTFMRSDAAPAVQKGSNAQFGIVEGDGSTITCVAGVCSSISGGAGTVTNNGNLTTHAPLVGGTNGTTDAKALAPMTNGQLIVGATGADPAPQTVSGDCTLANTGAITCTKINGDANVAFLDVNQAWTKGQAVTPVTGGAQAAGGTYTPDFSAANSVTLTFGAGNLTIANPTPTNVKAGQNYVIALTQDSVGSRTLTWGGNYKFAGGNKPALSSAANAVDVISCWAQTTTAINCALMVPNAS